MGSPKRCPQYLKSGESISAFQRLTLGWIAISDCVYSFEYPRLLSLFFRLLAGFFLSRLLIQISEFLEFFGSEFLQAAGAVGGDVLAVPIVDE